jgi:heparan-alpha-glucosaminide N-acetyltransferase
MYPNDPEGLFSTLTSFFNTFIGVQFCLILKKFGSDKKKLLIYWSGFGTLLCGCGLYLALWVPLCKKVWSVSFMFFTTGFSGVSLALIFLTIDILNKPILKKMC